MKKYFPTDYEEFIYKSRYSRWLPTKNRREDWPETVTRYLEFIKTTVQQKNTYSIPEETYNRLYNAILNFEIMPSMRALMSAGAALEKDNTAGYNCSYLPIDSPVAFDEAMYILMCGTGVGFSVEDKYTSQLPEIPAYTFSHNGIIVVEDSKEGWGLSLRELIHSLYEGMIPSWDISKVRPAGARLLTFGGRASGPEPLVELFEFIIDIFKNARGRKLTPIECHDIMCKIGEIVVVGGVRRSAMISLSDLDDGTMAKAKSGEWWETNKQRALSNNSAIYETKPTSEVFLKEWLSLVESKSGERGIFNREAAKKQAGKNGRRISNIDWGTNPCCEIILRPYQFCNLTEVVVREYDTIESLQNKVELATILGTFQSTLTYFPYLRKIWTDNTEEERLLGVSLTGIMDNPILNGNYKEIELDSVLTALKTVAVRTNTIYAKRLHVNVSTAITCVKPSGTVSQLVDASSGMHARHNDYYIRSVRADNKDPLTKFMKDMGIPYEPELGKENATTIFYFPKKAPSGAVLRKDMTALEQLELWLIYQQYWCEHKPSITISVKDDEWIEVGAWVFKHFDEVSGISFLPFSEHIYKQAPYQDINDEAYYALLEKMPKNIDWLKLSIYEHEDNTLGMQTLACSGDVCEIVDI